MSSRRARLFNATLKEVLAACLDQSFAEWNVLVDAAS